MFFCFELWGEVDSIISLLFLDWDLQGDQLRIWRSLDLQVVQGEKLVRKWKENKMSRNYMKWGEKYRKYFFDFSIKCGCNARESHSSHSARVQGRPLLFHALYSQSGRGGNPPDLYWNSHNSQQRGKNPRSTISKYIFDQFFRHFRKFRATFFSPFLDQFFSSKNKLKVYSPQSQA